MGSDLGVALAPVDHHEVLEAICEAAQVAFGAGHAPSPSSTLTPASSCSQRRPVGAASVIGMRLPVKRGIAGYVVASGQAIAVHDVERDPGSTGRPRRRRDTSRSRSWRCRSRPPMGCPASSKSSTGPMNASVRKGSSSPGSSPVRRGSLCSKRICSRERRSDGAAGRGQASKSEDPDLARSLRVVADRIDGPSAELADIAACFREISSLGPVERHAALAILEEFAAYARRQSRRR